jgi:hypothetical protein
MIGAFDFGVLGGVKVDIGGSKLGVSASKS